jgi:DNA gyrase subunit B
MAQTKTKRPRRTKDTVTKSPAQDYSAEKIQVLQGIEAVRRRPGMYIGTTGPRGLHHLVYEVVDNAVDEALAGFCDTISVTIGGDNSVTVADNGRGIPVDTHPTEKKPGVEVAMTTLHAGGKFDHGSYKVSGGLHGVGVSVVNALSEWLEVEVMRDDARHRQRYERGKKASELEEIGKTKSTGTVVRFRPDPEIFPEIDFQYDMLASRLRELAFLNAGLEITLTDEREKKKQDVFKFAGGLVEFVKHLNKNRKALHPKPIYVEATKDEVEVQCAIQYNDSYTETLFTFVNNINTHEGGTHLTGFKTALTRQINAYAADKGLLKKADFTLTGDDVREGLTAILSIKVMEPQFEGQTKTKLGNSEVRGIVESTMNEWLGNHFQENPGAGRAIVEKAFQAARAREAARKARDLTRKKSALESGILPGKLADCSIEDPEQAEIFIVEGDSAGGCWVPETEVAVASGGSRTIKDLADDWERGVSHFGYATNDDGDIRVVPLVEPRLTKRKAPLVEVELDNGARLRCTPDHPFRLRDGSYAPAASLRAGDSLMPLKRRLSDEQELPAPGYEMVWMNAGARWVHTHHLADLYVENVWKGLARWRASTTTEEKARGIRAGHRLKSLQLLSRVLNSADVGSAYEELRRCEAPTSLRWNRLVDEHFGGDEARACEAAAHVNCKVVAVRALEERVDVYDLTVERYHNFALASGVFVHNSAKMGRDRTYQAILPLRGKILNTIRARIDKVLSNEEIRAIITAVGTGFGEDEFKLEDARYGKIIVMADSDVDGAHIRTLVLTFFFQWMKELIENGRIYIALPPLYRVWKGNKESYVYNDEERDKAIERLGSNGVNVQRYKGLGEMNPDQLWKTTMDPESRILYQVTIEDEPSVRELFEKLMGDEVEPRRDWILNNAKFVRNLDV